MYLHKQLAPPTDVIKFNTDGCFNSSQGKGGWGVAARDSEDDVCGSGAGQLDYVQDALHAETEACLQALNLAQQWGMQRVQIETDSQILVQAINARDYDLSPNGVLFREIKAVAFLNFTSFSISFSPRTCNKVAYA